MYLYCASSGLVRLEKQKKGNSREAEEWRSKEAKKQKSKKCTKRKNIPKSKAIHIYTYIYIQHRPCDPRRFRATHGRVELLVGGMETINIYICMCVYMCVCVIWLIWLWSIINPELLRGPSQHWLRGCMKPRFHHPPGPGTILAPRFTSHVVSYQCVNVITVYYCIIRNDSIFLFFMVLNHMVITYQSYNYQFETIKYHIK